MFVNSMSDLFHDFVYDYNSSFIDEIFAVAAACPQHTFMILTKRSKIMKNYFNHPRRTMYVESALEWLYEGRIHMMPEMVWPLPNVWLGVSVEDQRAAEERISDLLETPAAIRFVSCEPLLGPVYLDEIPEVLLSVTKRKDAYLVDRGKLDWVIVGGESGPKARPMHPDWVRGIRDQCLAGNVPFFFKQWGEWVPFWNVAFSSTKRRTGIVFEGESMVRIGKKKAGRELDGMEWNEFPWGSYPKLRMEISEEK